VNDADCVQFLQWALPKLGLRWAGFRRVRRQVCRRIDARCRGLGLDGVRAYRDYLADRPAEWRELDHLCRVTISRFGRDRGIWSSLVDEILPALAAAAQARGSLSAWSAGCGAGEEPYSLAIAWHFAVAPRWPRLALDVVATDVDDNQLARAARACYPRGALRELPDPWRDAAFEPGPGVDCLRAPFRAPVRFERHDVRTPPPPGGPFDLVLCRNLAFTYLAEPAQRAAAASFRSVLRDHGVLVVGVHERLPDGAPRFSPRARSVYEAVGP